MHVRHTIQPATPLNVIDVRFDQGIQIFTACTSTGYAVYRAWPLTLLRKRDLTKGTLSMVQPLHTSSLLFLVGGGRSPLYPPNKVIIWDDALGREVAELEFRERVLGLAARREWLAVALKRRIVVYRFVDGVVARYREWETCVNMRGLMSLATAPESTLLAIPGRQAGHVQLIHLPPCPRPPPSPVQPSPISPHQPPPPVPAPGPPPMRTNSSAKAPISIILAHTTPLSTLCSPPSGRLLSTTSERGTLIRVWDTSSGKLVRELRRGTDKAEIYGVAFRGDESEVCVWSDKGTVHVFKIGLPTPDTNRGAMGNRHSSLSPLSPFFRLPKYFASEWSYASYRLPGPTAHISLSSALNSGGDYSASEDAGEEDKCVVGWIQVPVRIRTRRRRVNSNPPSFPAIPVIPLKGKGTGKGKYHVSDVIALDDEDEDQSEDEEVEEEVMQYQLVALTYSGCWYRLSVPSSSPNSQVLPSTIPSPAVPSTGAIRIPQSRDRDRTSHHHAPSVASGSSSSPPSHIGLSSSSSPPGLRSSGSSGTRNAKGKEKDKAESDGEKVGRQCVLEEFRRFGRWDGWA